MNRKACVVTGASRGMGRGIALVLAKEAGCRVYATARDKEALNNLAEEVSQSDSDGQIVPCELDQNDDQAVRNFVQSFQTKENRIDLLVNSAYAGLVAIAPHCGKPFWERPISVFDASLMIGLRSSYVMSSLFAPMMVKQKSGLMIQVSSFGGVQYLFDVGYGVGKAGLDRLSADMAAELKPHGVYAITLHPGAAVTEVTAFPDGETPIFSGRAVTALLNKANKDHLEKLNGKVVQAAELAVDYDFVDIDGKMPTGVEITKTWRDAMSSPLIQYSFEADLPDPSKSLNHPDVSAFFPGAKNYKV